MVLCVLPLFHIFSLNSVLLCAVRADEVVMLMPKFEMGGMLEGIKRWRVTVAAVVPPLVLALAKNPGVEKHDLISIRIVLSGAAPLGMELEDALRGRLPQVIFGQIREQPDGVVPAGAWRSRRCSPFPTFSIYICVCVRVVV